MDFQGLFKSALTASLARPDRIVGFHQSQAREPIAALFYSNRIRAESAHIVDRNLELATGSGASSVVCTFPLPEGTPEGVLPDGDFVLASPAGGLARQAMAARVLLGIGAAPEGGNGPAPGVERPPASRRRADASRAEP